LQGPSSRQVLEEVTQESWSGFRFCRLKRMKIGGVSVMVARQGFTGELGYELWVKREDALSLWDAVYEAGQKHGILPAGEYALDVARLEAGLTLATADYTNAGPDGRSAHVPADRTNLASPFELGLGKYVDLSKGDFIGREALQQEQKNGGPSHALVGIEIDWRRVQALYEARQLPPEVSPRVRWDALAIVENNRKIGRATSASWSATLGKMIGFACIERLRAKPGERLTIAWADWGGRPMGTASATVVPYPFIPMKRAGS
jgi:aminomethyltransferase